MKRLRDKVAIVTGAAHGIGRAIAEAFSKEGAIVLALDIDAKAGAKAVSEMNRNGVNCQYVRCDVSSSAQIARIVKTAIKHHGRLDVLCNNAAFLGEFHAAGETHEKEWLRSFKVSLMGTQHFIQAAIPHMVRQKSGSIINISSVQGLVGARNSAAYTSIKTALIGLTRSVAYDYGEQGVRCNAICPGAIRTRISPKSGSELHRRQVSKTFLGRVGEPREVAGAAVFLASDEASYVTGIALPVDGGWTAM